MKILSIDIVHPTKYLNFCKAFFEKKTGKIGEWVYTSRPGNQKAVVIAATVPGNPDRLVVTKEFRVPLKDYEWGLPAGLIEEGEHESNIIATVKRELKEETGLEIKEILEVSPPIYSTAGITDESVYVVWVTAQGTPSKNYLEETEDIETFLMTKEEVEDLLFSQSVKIGAKAYFVMRDFIKK